MFSPVLWHHHVCHCHTRSTKNYSVRCISPIHIHWACEWMCVSSFFLSHTHSNTSRRRLCKRLMKQEMQSSLVFWLRFIVCEALRAASWSLSRSSKLRVWRRDKFSNFYWNLFPERRAGGIGTLAVSIHCLLIKTGRMILVLYVARGAGRFCFLWCKPKHHNLVLDSIEHYAM